MHCCVMSSWCDLCLNSCVVRHDSQRNSCVTYTSVEERGCSNVYLNLSKVSIVFWFEVEELPL